MDESHEHTASVQPPSEATHTDSVNGDGLPEVSEARRKEIIAELRAARVLLDEDPETVELMVQAYLESGGLPSRIVHAGEGAYPVPDLTETSEGREVLDGLSEQAGPGPTAQTKEEN